MFVRQNRIRDVLKKIDFWFHITHKIAQTATDESLFVTKSVVKSTIVEILTMSISFAQRKSCTWVLAFAVRWFVFNIEFSAIMSIQWSLRCGHVIVGYAGGWEVSTTGFTSSAVQCWLSFATVFVCAHYSTRWQRDTSETGSAISK